MCCESRSMTISSGSRRSHSFQLSSPPSETEINLQRSQCENQVVTQLRNEIYESFIKYKKVIGKAIQPFIRLDPSRSCEDFMQEAFIPFCKGYYYCNAEKVEKSLATNLIFNCVRHYFVDQYEDWNISHQENISKGICNSLWKESNNHPGHCRRVNTDI